MLPLPVKSCGLLCIATSSVLRQGKLTGKPHQSERRKWKISQGAHQREYEFSRMDRHAINIELST